jgi:hypothetical protein
MKRAAHQKLGLYLGSYGRTCSGFAGRSWSAASVDCSVRASIAQLLSWPISTYRHAPTYHRVSTYEQRLTGTIIVSNSDQEARPCRRTLTSTAPLKSHSVNDESRDHVHKLVPAARWSKVKLNRSHLRE